MKKKNAPSGAKRPPMEMAARMAVEEVAKRSKIFYPHPKHEEWDGSWEED